MGCGGVLGATFGWGGCAVGSVKIEGADFIRKMTPRATTHVRSFQSTPTGTVPQALSPASDAAIQAWPCQ